MTTFPTPQWTAEITDTFVTGEDMLGVEGAAQSYQHEYIPGITTVTDRARYYSFYAWVLYRYINLSGTSFKMEGFRGVFFRRHEMAFLLAAFSHHFPNETLGGLIGSGVNSYKARDWWEAQDPVSLDSNYFQNKLGGFGQYYRTVMQVMEIVVEPANSKLVFRLTERGEALAQAYEKSIETSHYFHQLAEKGQLTDLSHADATDLGLRSCLCPKSLALGKDLPLLRDTFFRFDQQGEKNPHTQRRLALGVALDIVAKGEGTYTEEMLRPALYIGEFSPGNRYDASPELSIIAKRWRMVEVRHLYTFGLQALWGAFLLKLRTQANGMGLENYLDWVSEVLPDGIASLPASDFLNKVCAQSNLPAIWRQEHPSFDLACSLSNPENEYTLFLQASAHPTDPVVLVKAGVDILSRHFLRFLSLQLANDSIWLNMAQRPRLPIFNYYGEFRLNLDKDNWTVRGWLMWLYHQYILGQHQFIALEKLRYQDYDTFKYLYRDGRFYWPFSKPEAYREPIRLAANRLANTISMLVDLGMIDRDVDGRHSLTSEGNQALKRIKGEPDGN